jgi:hypothetical protein
MACQEDGLLHFWPSNIFTPPGSPISGPAKYISLLFPSSLPPVSPLIVDRLLEKSRLSPCIVALAACIVDTLSTKFYRKWLLSLPHYLEAIHPEIIVVACLCIAMKFLEDIVYPMSVVVDIFHDVLDAFGLVMPITDESIRALETLILEDINYNILRLLADQGLQFMATQFKRQGYVIDYSLSIVAS